MSDWRGRAGGTGYSPEKKSSHATADYRQGTAERHCSICAMYRPGPHCTAVVDPIRGGGLCDYYKAKK
jgi:hypothetical protein